MRFYHLILFIPCLILSSFAESGIRSLQPHAKQGRIDLSDWDFNKGTIKLEGEWEFYWKKFYSNRQLDHNLSLYPDRMINLPSQWKGLSIGDEILPLEGYATLRIRVRINSSTQSGPMAFKVNRWTNPFVLYIDDRKITSVGRIGTSAATETYDSRPHIAEFHPPGDTFDIIMHVSNFTGKKASCTYSLQLGLEQHLQKQRTLSIALQYIVFGAIFFIGICLLLAYYAIRPFHSAMMFLGITCIIISLRSLFMGEAHINDLLPSLPLFIKFKIELSLLYSLVVFINLYGQSLFPNELKKWFIQLVSIPHIVFVIIVILFDYDLALLTQLPHHLLIVFDGSFVLLVLSRAVAIRRKAAITFLASFAVFFITALHDMLVFHQVIATPYLLNFGFLGFMSIQTLLVTYLYSKSTRDLSILTEKLDHTANQLLELKEPSVPKSVDIELFCKKYQITSREKNVIALIASGASNNEIAEHMFISFNTVRRHLYNIYRKCGVSERDGLISVIKKHSDSTENRNVSEKANSVKKRNNRTCMIRIL